MREEPKIPQGHAESGDPSAATASTETELNIVLDRASAQARADADFKSCGYQDTERVLIALVNAIGNQTESQIAIGKLIAMKIEEFA